MMTSMYSAPGEESVFRKPSTMLLKEYRVCMPLTVQEVGLLKFIMIVNTVGLYSSPLGRRSWPTIIELFKD